MDAIKKKIQSLKSETLQLESHIAQLTDERRLADVRYEKSNVITRDLSKKVILMESDWDTNQTLVNQCEQNLEEKEKNLAVAEDDLSGVGRRMALLESEVIQSERLLGQRFIELANTCKLADDVLRKVRYLESKCMGNEVNVDDLEKMYHEARTMYNESEKKLDENFRRLNMMKEELRRSEERADQCDNKILELEEELKMVGENMIALEVTEEKALAREERYKETIQFLRGKVKEAESRIEYGEMNVTKLQHRIEDIEDDIVREKLKSAHVADEIQDALEDLFTK